MNDLPTNSNWPAIRAHYESTGESLRQVAARFEVSERTLFRRSSKEGWQQSGGSAANGGSKNGSNRGTDANLAAKNGTPDTAPLPENGSKGGSGGSKCGSTDPESGSASGSGTPECGSKVGTAAIPAAINTLDRLAAAQFYATTLGWAIHPLLGSDRGEPQERGKKPLLKGWRNHIAADITPDFLTRYFGNGSNHNIGCVVRPPFIHVDLDSKPDAGASVQEWLATQQSLAAVPRERTGGGAHLAFICRDIPEEVMKAKKAPTSQINDKVSAELYLDGLNLVLSPSVHKSGHIYQWDVTGDIPEVKWADLCRWFGFATPEVKKPGRPGKEKPWWSRWDQDLRTLDLAGVMEDLGRLGACLDPDTNKWSVRCPWEKEHSAGANDAPGSDTIIFNRTETMPGFKCLHAHCEARGIRDLVEWAEKQKPGIIASRCANLRVWQPGNNNAKGRPQIILPALGRAHGEFGTQLGNLIAPTLDMFCFADNVVEIKTIQQATKKGAIPGQMLSIIKPAELVTAVERTVETGVTREDEAGDEVFVPKSMSEQDARITLVSGFFSACLPRINRVLDVPVPHLSDDGKIIYPAPGYDERFGTWLNPHAPVLKTMGLTEALRWLLQDLFGLPEHGGFWWHDEQARVHALARFITPFCRGLMDWRRTPLWIFDGNREGCGKDTCADLTHLAYTGRSIICAPLSKDCDDEMRKRITSALLAGSRFFHLANMKGHVRYASLEAATDDSGVWEDRRLGVSETITLPNETEYSFSANNATWEPDIERRCRRIRLRFTPDDINGHRYRHTDIKGWVRRHRSELLSAVATLVNEWMRQGCPDGPSPFTSFPEWGRVVGGILHCVGLPDPCRPHEDSTLSGDQSTKAMRDFFAVAFERFGDREVLKKEFQEFVQQDEGVHELFDWIDFAARRGQTMFGKLIAKFDKRELGGITFRLKQSSKNYATYRFFREGEGELPIGRTLPEPATKVVGHEDIVGHSTPSHTCEKNTDEKNKNEKHLTAVHTAEGETSHNVLMSHNPVFCSIRSDLDRVAADLAGASRIALDIETYGQRKGDGLDPWKGDIRLLTLSKHGGTIWTIDLRATGYELGPLTPILEQATLIAHNAKFDLLWLRVKCGLFATKIACTLTAARLLAAGTKPGNNLDQCLERYLQIPPAPDHSRSDWASMLLTEDQLAYAARDVAHLHDLLCVLEGELEMNDLQRVWALETELLPVVVKMEAIGIRVDRAKLEVIAAEADKQAQVAATDLRTALGNPSLNPASPSQVLAALRAKGITLESTAEEALKAADDGTLIPMVLAHRETSKRAQQAEALVDHIQSDGRIHGRFEPLGTATGRFSSKEPNLQNIGRGELREAFAVQDGRRLVVADYSQIELRAAAAIAGETRMIDAYKAGADLHKRTAATVLGKSENEVTKDDRQLSKACFSGDTEVLTPKGWVRFENYDGTTPVAQFELPEGIEWNPPRPRSNRWGHPTGKVHYHGDGTISFVRPIDFKSFDDRELFHHEDRNTDLLLTADHQVAFITNTGNPIKRAAIEVTEGNCRHFIAAGTMTRQKPDARMEAFTRTLAMVVADGYFSSPRCVRFGFSKQRKVERCLKLLGELGLTPRISISGRVTSISVTNEEWVENLLSWITVKKDLSWRCVTELPTSAYLDEAGYWDSHLIRGMARDRALFSTTSKQTAEVMQAMAATSGIPSLLRHEPRTNEKHSDIWNLSYIHDGPTTWRVSWNLKPTGRRERVWCVQVPSGAILIRRNGKVCVQGNCNFGLIYGQSAPGLVRYAATSYGVTMTGDQATEIRQAFFRTYSRLRQWHGLSHNQAEAGIAEVRTRTGRRRLVPTTATDWERFTALVNTPVQGGTADGMKQALILIDQRLPQNARIVSTVHDEVVVECHEDSADQCREIITTAMVEAMAALFPEVPVEVEANVCTTWAEK